MSRRLAGWGNAVAEAKDAEPALRRALKKATGARAPTWR